MTHVQVNDHRFLLFVYGTLLRGGCRHFLLADQSYLGVTRTAPQYFLYDCGDYPAMVSNDPGNAVEGELYEVDVSLIPQLDWVEGAPTLFRLEEIRLADTNDTVYAYLYQREIEEHPLCRDNRWVIDRRLSTDSEDS